MKDRFTIKKVVLALVVVYTISSVIFQEIKINNIKEEITTQDKALQELKDSNRRLKNEVEFSKTDEYIEKMARERLGYIKPGETPVLGNNNSK